MDPGAPPALIGESVKQSYVGSPRVRKESEQHGKTTVQHTWSTSRQRSSPVLKSTSPLRKAETPRRNSSERMLPMHRRQKHCETSRRQNQFRDKTYSVTEFRAIQSGDGAVVPATQQEMPSKLNRYRHSLPLADSTSCSKHLHTNKERSHV
jgi:hypothetical protein